MRSVVTLAESLEDRAPLLPLLPWIQTTLGALGLRDGPVAHAGATALVGISHTDGTEVGVGHRGDCMCMCLCLCVCVCVCVRVCVYNSKRPRLHAMPLHQGSCLASA